MKAKVLKFKENMSFCVAKSWYCLTIINKLFYLFKNVFTERVKGIIFLWRSSCPAVPCVRMSWRIHSLPAVDTGSADSASAHTGTSLLHWETPSVPSVKVMINNNHIERVYENKFLGGILDHKICWEPLIQHVRAKEAWSIGVMGKARHFWNNRALYMLYCSLVLPYFNCCVEVWGNTYITNSKKTFKVRMSGRPKQSNNY